MKIVLAGQGLHISSSTRGIGVYARELMGALTKYYPADSVTSALPGDIIHYPFFDPFSRTLKIDSKVPTVVTVHDLIPLRFPQHFPIGWRGKFNWWAQQRSISRVAHIITDSQSSQKDIINIMGIAKEKITVIPLGPNHTQKVSVGLSNKIAQNYSLPHKYLLYVGDINWNKNLPGLIKSFSEIEDSTLRLVLVGKVFSDKPNIPEYRSLMQAINQSGKSDRIVLIGFVPSHHLSVFYARATLYVQPSWYEGFGLPILEAMKFGCPVASSNRGSLPEVGGEAVAYFDPGKTMTATLSTLLHSRSRLEELSAQGTAQAKLFTWDKTASLTHKVYEQVLSSRA